MDYTALDIPLVQTRKRYLISHAQVGNSWRDIHIVGNKHRVTRRELHDEALVAGTLVVVGKNS